MVLCESLEKCTDKIGTSVCALREGVPHAACTAKKKAAMRRMTGARRPGHARAGGGWCPLLSNGWGGFGYYAVPVFAHLLHLFLLLLLLLL